MFCKVIAIVLIWVSAQSLALADAKSAGATTPTVSHADVKKQQISPLVKYPFTQPYFQTFDDGGKIAYGIVTSGIQDKNGILWLGTQNGLVEYDGYQYRQYRYDADNPNSLPGDYLMDIKLQANGDLWIATRSNGLAKFNPVSRRFERFAYSEGKGPLGSNTLRGVFVAKDQSIWVGHESGIDHLSHQGQTLHHYRLPQGHQGTTYTFYQTDDNEIWAGGAYGLVKINDGKVTIADSLTDLNVRTVFKDSDGTYWLGTKKGLYLWSGTGKAKPPNGVTSQQNKALFENVVQGKNGMIWASSYGAGLWLFDGQSKRLLRRFVHDPSIRSSLAFDDIGKIILDNNQNLWIGTWGRGLQRLQLGSIDNFATIRYSPIEKNGLSYGNIRSILPLQNGLWLFGRNGIGIDIFDPDTGRIDTISETIDGEKLANIITMAQDNQGIVWGGSFSSGLFRIDVPQRQANAAKIAELEKTDIITMLTMSNGELVIGSGKGPCVLNSDKQQCEFIKNQDNTPFVASTTNLTEDQHGNLWGGSKKGLFRRKANNGYLESFTSQNSNLSGDLVKGALAHKGKLYLLTGKEFVVASALNEAQPSFSKPSQQINFSGRMPGGNMLMDGRDRLWSAMSLVDFQSKRYSRLSKVEGINIGTLWLGSFAQEDSGLMLFGGTEGVLLVNPDSFEPNLPSSKILIRQLEIEGQSHSLPGKAPLRLSASQRDFNLQIAAIDLNDATNISYQYRLVGQNHRWQSLDANSRWISYTNLSPGQYTLEVKGQYLHNQGTVTPLNMRLTVTPAFWQTIWFKLLIAIVFLALLYLFIRWRVQFLKEKARQLERLVAQKTQELEAINVIGREFTTHLAMDEVFDEIYNHIQQIVKVDAFGIGIVDTEQQVIIFEYAIEQGVRFNRYTRSMTQPQQLAVYCVLNNRSILVNDYDREYSEYHQDRDDLQQKLSDGRLSKTAQSMVYVPLSVQKQVIGVISMQSFAINSYNQSDVLVLETLASYAAIAVENAKVHENLLSLHQQLGASLEELKEAQAKLIMQEKMTFLGQLVAGVAHEVNTPLGIAVTGISVMDDKLVELKQTVEQNRLKRQTLSQFIDTSFESLNLIRPNLDKTAGLIQQFKRVAANDGNTSITNTDIQPLLQQVITAAEEKAESANISLILENPRPLNFETVPSVLSQVIVIIVDNAIQHAFVERSKGKVIIRYFECDEGLTIECQDDGIGISASDHEQVFAPFYTTSRFSGATGLGLSIAFNIVNKQLSGSLTLSSQPDKGTTFSIVLPVTKQSSTT